MAKLSYDLSKLEEATYDAIARELLNGVESLNLIQTNIPKPGFDFMRQNDAGELKTVALIKGSHRVILTDFHDILEDVDLFLEEYNSVKYFIVFFSSLDFDYIDAISEYDNINIDYNFKIYDLNWINQKLFEFPHIVNKFNLELLNNDDYKLFENAFRLERKYFIVSYIKDNNNKSLDFINNSYWDGNLSDKNKAISNEIKPGDVLFLSNKRRNKTFVYAIGVVQEENYDNNYKINVSWNRFSKPDSITLDEFDDFNTDIKRILPSEARTAFLSIQNIFPSIISILMGMSSKTLNLKEIQYWWIKANKDYWKFSNLKKGNIHTFSILDTTYSENSKQEYFYEININDLVIGYQTVENIGVKVVFEVYDIIDDGSIILLTIVDVFAEDEKLEYRHIKELQLFSKSEVVIEENEGNIYKLTKDEFDEVINVTDSIVEVKSMTSQQTGSVNGSNDLAHAKKDLLGFEPDVKVLASLIALKKMDPPLAIALFGNWGMGKSFFMHHLEKKINELSKYQGFIESKGQLNTEYKVLEGNKYCKGIAQIKFNAWSYVDSNLWAGLVSSIFEKLNEYIAESTKSGVAKLKVQEKLREQLTALQVLKETEEQKKKRLETLKENYKVELEKLEKGVVIDIGNELLAINNTDDELSNAFNELAIEQNIFGKNFNIEGAKLVSEYKYWSNFYDNFKKTPQLIGYLKIVIFVVMLTLSIICSFNWEFFSFSTPIISAISGVSAILSKAGVWWRSNYSNVKNYVNIFNSFIESKTELKADLGKLENNINLVEEEKKYAKAQIKELKNKITKVQIDLNENLTEAAINDFIGERAQHKDYKEHLGIVSTIRKDFETLSELFIESKEVNKKSLKENRSEINKKELLDLDREFINDQFETGKKLERIILYIDDLDRCSDEKVLEVLQAVHLLMAFPLFIVVVGVDKRCVNNALNHKNISQYFNSTGAKNLKQLKEEFDIEVIKPNEYLEKIFQIPFQIPNADCEGIHNMIDDLFDGQIADVDIMVDDIIDEKGDIDVESFVGIGYKNNETDSPIGNIYSEEIEGKNSRVENTIETPPDLTITPEELNQIKKISELVGNTPRTIKRFVNLYRILRAHSQLSHDSLSKNEKLAIMFTLAINIGKYKVEAKRLFDDIRNENNYPLSKYLTNSNYIVFYNQLKKNGMEDVLDLFCEDINKHLPFIERFSFDEICNSNKEQKNAK